MEQLKKYISEKYDKPLVWSYSGNCDIRYMYGRHEIDDTINFIILYEKNNISYIDLLVFYEYGDNDGYRYDYFCHTADVFVTIKINNKSFLKFEEISEKYGFGSCIYVCEAIKNEDGDLTYKIDDIVYVCNDTDVKNIKDKQYYYKIYDNDLYFVNEDVRNNFVCEFCEYKCDKY
jgi:hypothetical protein